jgi:hypothetical protein
MSQNQPPQDHYPNTANPQTTTGAATPTGYGYQPSDEIDLVELLGFFWKIKIEIAVGALLGIAAGAFVALKVLPVTYHTQIPLVLEKNELGVAEPKKLVESFNSALNVSDNARLIWRSVFNQSPELARTLKENNLGDEALAAQQALADKPEKAPLRLRESASPRDFILDVRLPVQGLNQRSGELFASAIQMALSVNAAAVADTDKDAPSKPTNANAPSGTPVQKLQPDESTEVREQLLKARQELLKIEYLCSKLGRNLPEFFAFVGSADADLKSLQVNLPAPPADGSTQNLLTSDFYEQVGVQGQFERIQRMTAVLLAEGRMKPEDANDTVTRSLQVRDEIFQLIPVARREAMRMAGLGYGRRTSARGEARSGSSSALAALPILVPASATGATLSLESPVSKRKISLVLGAFLGAFAGFAVGGLRVFLKKNGQRLREVMAQ